VGAIQRMKVWLGLADEYDEFDEEFETNDQTPRPELARPQEYTTPYGGQSAVRRVEREPDMERARGAKRGSFDEMARSFSDDGGPQEYSTPPRASYDRAADRPIAAVPAQPQVTMHIVEPRSFSEAQSIADKFKSGTPVIVNLTATDSELAKRLLDFSSGLTYGLDGHLQKVSDKVFMLTPRNVDVSAEDRRKLKDRGVFGEDG
jgi:cell division inhibitor SepF